MGASGVAAAASSWYAAMYTILVADDDPSLLTIVAQILAEPGHIVLTASDGFEAVRILADRHVDLMIADVRMPGLDGLQLGRQAKLMRRNLHIIFISGRPLGGEAIPGFGTLLEKPIRAAALLEAVRTEMSTP
ncbi:MAG TPA: response regulator [Stellaceae bacterium]|nr:response regulator [Stellaceae bacterium]